ncbi:sulfite exporter TauE/SafE family protein [Sphingomonas sp. AP4-R1]|uniref:sulfite exporter TauE/SafE family protein n=1 Tax=Sphingomonas sp. AP4-R1 TaxID=2735134 RepID=UPI00149339AA|nr:sulfite exporter TauE/SafE family protein [Sphingomonas sp. AP4-R1]QJU56908.1 sulfite exporter TauE/SafE family protein [Sphingomonas sp. AP4-R1]
MVVAFVFLAATAAFATSAVAGGGAGLILVPLLRTILPVSGVPAALSIGTAASSLSRIVVFRRAIRWDVVRRFVPLALPSAALGAWLLTRFEPAYVELILAFFLLANLPQLFRKSPAGDSGTPPLDRKWLVWIGAAAGLFSGFTGAVGLLFNGLYRRIGMDRHEIVATRATNEVLLHLLKIALYSAFGLMTPSTLAAGLLVAVAAILASIAVRWILPHLDEALFRRIGQVAMVAAGFAMLSLSSNQIARIHRAWLTVVTPGVEREVHLYWGGRQWLAAEIEAEGDIAFERSIPFATLPPHLRRAAHAKADGRAIALVEEVHSLDGLSYEIHYRGGNPDKIELRRE